jgi:hypothetical protein
MPLGSPATDEGKRKRTSTDRRNAGRRSYFARQTIPLGLLPWQTE